MIRPLNDKQKEILEYFQTHTAKETSAHFNVTYNAVRSVIERDQRIQLSKSKFVSLPLVNLVGNASAKDVDSCNSSAGPQSNLVHVTVNDIELKISVRDLRELLGVQAK